MPPQNAQSLEKSSCNRDPKVIKNPEMTQITKVRSIRFVSPIRSSKGLSRPIPNPLVIHSSLLSGLDFGLVHQPRFKQFWLNKTLRTVLKQKEKPVRYFVDLTAVYDTAWQRGLTCKLLRLLPDKIYDTNDHRAC